MTAIAGLSVSQTADAAISSRRAAAELPSALLPQAIEDDRLAPLPFG